MSDFLPSPPAQEDVSNFAWKRWFQRNYQAIDSIVEYSNVPAYIFNGDMQFCQAHGSTFTPTAAFTAGDAVPDMFSVSYGANYTNYTPVRQATLDLPIFKYCYRHWKNFGSSDTTQQSISHDMETLDVFQYQGKQVTFSFWLRAGVDFEGRNVSASIVYGTGTDQNLVSGYTGASSIVKVVRPTNTWERFSISGIVPTTAAQMGLVLYWTHSGVTTLSTDYVETTGWQLDVGHTALPFRMHPFEQRLAACQRRYFKTFPLDTAPATNSGLTTGCYRWPAIAAGAVVNRGPHFPFPTTMRVAPTVTIYNPSAANNQVRDQTAGVDCTGSVAQLGIHSTILAATGNAATAVGNFLGAHFTADSRF